MNAELPPAQKARVREAEGLMGSRDYYKSTEKQERVAAIYREAYPGEIQTAPLNPTSSR